jgi:hypothetical protein
MPKAPLKAQIVIGLFAVLVIAYGSSIVRLDGTSSGTRTAFPGQLIAVRIDRTMYYMASSDAWVVKPISVSTSPVTRAYFLALKPGRATLSAHNTSCIQCLVSMWSVEVFVRPG